MGRLEHTFLPTGEIRSQGRRNTDTANVGCGHWSVAGAHTHTREREREKERERDMRGVHRHVERMHRGGHHDSSRAASASRSILEAYVRYFARYRHPSSVDGRPSLETIWRAAADS